MSNTTAPKIEIVLHPHTRPEQLQVIQDAIAYWCALSEHYRVFHELRLTINGGPYLSPNDTIAFWRAAVPPGAVAEVVVDGKNLTAECDTYPGWNDAEADISAATIH